MRDKIKFLRWYVIDVLQELLAAFAHYHEAIRQGRDFFQDALLLQVRLAQDRVQRGDNWLVQAAQERQDVAARASAEDAIFVLQNVVDVQKVRRAAIRGR